MSLDPVFLSRLRSSPASWETAGTKWTVPIAPTRGASCGVSFVRTGAVHAGDPQRPDRAWCSATGHPVRGVWAGPVAGRLRKEDGHEPLGVIVLITLGAAAIGAVVVLYHLVPIEIAAGEARAYFLTLNAPPGTVTTEANPAYKGAAAALQPTAPPAQRAAADWPSYNKTLTSERFSDLSQINTNADDCVGRASRIAAPRLRRSADRARAPQLVGTRPSLAPA